MGIMDDLEKEARDLAGKVKELAETKGQDLLAQGKHAIGAKTEELKNQAAKRVTDFVNDQKQKLTDKFEK